MKMVSLLLSMLLAATPGATETSQPAPKAGDSAGGPVFVVPIHDEISSSQFFFLRRAIKEAERQHASALVVSMNTYGGEVSAAIDMMDALMKTDLPTYTYVDDKAISAGAMITLATRKIYMAPTGVIGAAAPVQSSGEDLPSTMSLKTVSAISAILRNAAEKCGHDPAVAEAFVRKEAEFKIGDEVLDKSDTLLTLDAHQASRRVEGKPVLAEAMAPDLTAMLQAAGLTGPVRQLKPAGFERLAFLLTSIAPLLLLGGLVGGYLEFKTPGFGLPGIAAAICFTLFFASHYVAGLAGWEVLALFLIGFLLVASELFVHPGTVLPGVLGVVFIFGSLLYAMVDRYPDEPWWPTGPMLARPLFNLALAMVGTGAAIYCLGKYLPRSQFYRRIVLAETTPPGAGPLLPEAAPQVVTGDRGMARTILRPSGKAEFAGRLLDVVSQGEYIDAGRAVRVIAVEGSRIVVLPETA